MIFYKKGDILNATENIICHQVNVNGIMGGGLAKQIATKYPKVEKFYSWYAYRMYNDYSLLKGKKCSCHINDNQRIENCFTQKPNSDTDYDAIRICFDKLCKEAKEDKKTIAIPNKYGCGIANGNWLKVRNIFEELSNKYDISITIYELPRKE